MAHDEVIPRAASTTIFVRDGAAKPEILLLKRGARAKFMPNAHVFAGGAVDASDESAQACAVCTGLDERLACERLHLESAGLRHFVAAMREAFEECGLLLAYDSAGKWVDLDVWDEPELLETRRQLSAGSKSLAALCESHGWRLAAEQLVFFSHWITPPGVPRRFDTRFFLCPVPAKQKASLASDEMSELVWITAEQALAEYAAKRLLLMFPTRTLLAELAEFERIDALFDYARRPRKIMPYTPVVPPDFHKRGIP
jgi:8-oxo-dGTP pyrophosphatase MutT (NUDIX family)